MPRKSLIIWIQRTDYQRVHGKEQTSKQDQWCPPPVGYYKVNVDAAVHAEQQLTGLGVVIRNSQGQVIVAAFKSTKFEDNVTAAKAEAVKWGLEMALEARLAAVIIETDCIEVANLANNETSSRKEIVWTISDIHSYKEKFQSLSMINMSQDVVIGVLTLLLKEL